MDPELVRIGLENKKAREDARDELLALRETVKDNKLGLKELAFPTEKRIEGMTLDTLTKWLDLLRPEVNQRLTASNTATGQKLGIQFSENPKVQEPDSDDDDEASSSQVLKPVQPTQQNLIIYQDPALLNHFQRIERSTMIDLDRDLRNAGIADETIVNMNMDEKQEYAKLIREMNYGSASRLVGSTPNPKFKDLLDNRYTDQYIFEANKAAVLADKPKLPPIEELWRRQKELKLIPSSEVRFNKLVNLKQLNPFERHALKYHDNRPGVAPRYKNQGAPQKDDPIVYGGKLHLQKRIPTNPTRLVV